MQGMLSISLNSTAVYSTETIYVLCFLKLLVFVSFKILIATNDTCLLHSWVDMALAKQHIKMVAEKEMSSFTTVVLN